MAPLLDDISDTRQGVFYLFLPLGRLFFPFLSLFCFSWIPTALRCSFSLPPTLAYLGGFFGLWLSLRSQLCSFCCTGLDVEQYGAMQRLNTV
jgi:hypothetical protein